MKYFFLALLLCSISVCSMGQDLEQQTLRSQKDSVESKIHLIIFADTLSDSIKSACIKDKENILKWISNVSFYTGMKLKIYNQQGLFTKNAVDSLLKDIVVGKNDVVVFYYTGHGYRLEKQVGDYPYLAFHNINIMSDKLNLETIHNSLKLKNGRLIITIGDLCNTIPKYETRPIEFKGVCNKAEYELLFLSATGDIIITSSQPYQFSSTTYDKGSLFTAKFLEIFDNSTQQYFLKSWKDILDITKKEVEDNARRLHCTQTPLFKSSLSYK